jgi:hypothetical protein
MVIHRTDITVTGNEACRHHCHQRARVWMHLVSDIAICSGFHPDFVILGILRDCGRGPWDVPFHATCFSTYSASTWLINVW